MIEMPSGASGISTVERSTRCAPESCHSIVARASPGQGGPSGGLASRIHSPTSTSSRPAPPLRLVGPSRCSFLRLLWESDPYANPHVIRLWFGIIPPFSSLSLYGSETVHRATSCKRFLELSLAGPALCCPPACDATKPRARGHRPPYRRPWPRATRVQAEQGGQLALAAIRDGSRRGGLAASPAAFLPETVPVGIVEGS